RRGTHRHLHSFPARRSSDLGGPGAGGADDSGLLFVSGPSRSGGNAPGRVQGRDPRRQLTAGELSELIPPAARAPAGTLSRRATAAPTKLQNSGCARIGRPLNPGWNRQPTTYGCPGSSTFSTRRPSGLVPLSTKPAAVSASR